MCVCGGHLYLFCFSNHKRYILKRADVYYSPHNGTLGIGYVGLAMAETFLTCLSFDT